MLNRSIVYEQDKNQECFETHVEPQYIKFKGNNVLCPMCEHWHHNDTFCQISMEGGLS